MPLKCIAPGRLSKVWDSKSRHRPKHAKPCHSRAAISRLLRVTLSRAFCLKGRSSDFTLTTNVLTRQYQALHYSLPIAFTWRNPPFRIYKSRMSSTVSIPCTRVIKFGENALMCAVIQIPLYNRAIGQCYPLMVNVITGSNRARIQWHNPISECFSFTMVLRSCAGKAGIKTLYHMSVVFIQHCALEGSCQVGTSNIAVTVI